MVRPISSVFAERIHIGAYLLWVLVLAIMLLFARETSAVLRSRTVA